MFTDYVVPMFRSLRIMSTFLGRGAYIHMGAILGTMMAANVFIHIIPNQKIMLKEVEAGIPHDPLLAFAQNSDLA